MVIVKEICDYFDEKAPFYMKFDFDNIGLLVGSYDAAVTHVLVALDITDEVIDEAIENGAQLIVSHHPIIFEALKRVTEDDIKGRKIIKMLKNGISAVCLHTNMDSAQGGVNDALMTALGAKVTGLLDPHGIHSDGKSYGISRVGVLDEAMELDEFLVSIKFSLSANGLRYVSGGKKVKKIACCGGAGAGDMLKAIAAGCDTYVTADLKYDHFLNAADLGLNLIDADHFCTENVVVPVMADMLNSKFPELDIKVSQRHCQKIKFI